MCCSPGKAVGLEGIYLPLAQGRIHCTRSHQQSPTSCYEVSTVHSRVHHTGRDSQSVPQLPPGKEETTQLAFQDFTMVHSKSRKGFLNMLQTKTYFMEVQDLQTVAY